MLKEEESLLDKIKKLEETNKIIMESLEDIKKTTKRMEEHINFIEKTYSKVKTPFHYLMDKINVLTFSPFGVKDEILYKTKDTVKSENDKDESIELSN